MSHSSLPVALLASHPPCGSLWAAPKAPLGPRFPSGQFAALTRREKALYCPFLKEGVRNVARSMVELPTSAFVRARAHSFPLSKRARLFPSAAYRRSAPPPLGWGEGQIVRVGIIRCSMADFAGQKVDGVSTFCWPLERAGGPVARRRSVYANKQKNTLSPRAARPVAERR